MAARRFHGGYKSASARPEKQQVPIFALGCEGQTEARYSEHLARSRPIRMRPKVFPGRHGRELVDDVLTHAEELIRAARDPVPVVHKGVIFDIEKYTAQTIAEAREATVYAATKGVKVWISMPTIERWFLLHHKYIAHSRSKNVIKQQLDSHLKTARLPNYKKPGNVRFYGDLMPRHDFAVATCTTSHPSTFAENELVCICSFLAFLDALK